MNPRISKWLLIVCATMLGACSADSDLLGPASVQAPAVTPRAAGTAQPAVTGNAGTPNNTPRGAPHPAAQRGRGRYAMAAS